MSQSREQIIRTIREAFEASRESAGAPYDESKMIWHLVSHPKGRASIHNTFKGKRKLSKFLRKLEMHFLICFSQRDWERFKSIDEVADRIIFLLDTPRSSLQSIQSILKTPPPDMFALLVGVLSLPVVGIAVKILGCVGFVFLIFPAVIIVAIFRFDRKWKNFYRDIAKNIKTNKALQ